MSETHRSAPRGHRQVGELQEDPAAWARPPALAGVRARSQDVLSPAGVSFRPVTGSWRMKGATTPPQESTDLMFQVRQSYLSPARGLPRFSSVLSSRRVRNSGCGGPSRRGTFFRGRAAEPGGGASEPRAPAPVDLARGVSGAIGQAFSKRCGNSGNESRQERGGLLGFHLAGFLRQMPELEFKRCQEPAFCCARRSQPLGGETRWNQGQQREPPQAGPAAATCPRIPLSRRG